MSYNESVLKELLDLIPQTGRLEWIGIRPGKKQALTELKSVRIEQDSGLEGDRFRGSVSGKRQVTLIQQEHLQVVANILGKSEIDPGWTRRNLVVSVINLLSLKHQSFQIGEAVLQDHRHLCSLQQDGRKPRTRGLQRDARTWRNHRESPSLR